MDKNKYKKKSVPSEKEETKGNFASVPLVHSCECGLSKRKQFRVDDGEHGLTTAVTVTQRPPDHIQQTLGQQEPHICTQDRRTCEPLGW